jgi:hypothetical protein
MISRISASRAGSPNRWCARNLNTGTCCKAVVDDMQHYACRIRAGGDALTFAIVKRTAGRRHTRRKGIRRPSPHEAERGERGSMLVRSEARSNWVRRLMLDDQMVIRDDDDSRFV